jgi:hypothetical protein
MSHLCRPLRLVTRTLRGPREMILRSFTRISPTGPSCAQKLVYDVKPGPVKPVTRPYRVSKYQRRNGPVGCQPIEYLVSYRMSAQSFPLASALLVDTTPFDLAITVSKQFCNKNVLGASHPCLSISLTIGLCLCIQSSSLGLRHY